MEPMDEEPTPSQESDQNEAILLRLQDDRLHRYMTEQGIQISPETIALVEAEWPISSCDK
jgi:hypothetical protein